MLIEVARGHVRIMVGHHVAKISGEMLMPEPGLPDFLIFKNSIRNWEKPHECDFIDDAMKEQILQQVTQELEKLGRVVDICNQ